MKCHDCEKSEEETYIQKCPVCFRAFCEDHARIMSGRQFCSQRCGEYFFFSDPEED